MWKWQYKLAAWRSLLNDFVYLFFFTFGWRWKWSWRETSDSVFPRVASDSRLFIGVRPHLSAASAGSKRNCWFPAAPGTFPIHFHGMFCVTRPFRGSWFLLLWTRNWADIKGCSKLCRKNCGTNNVYTFSAADYEKYFNWMLSHQIILSSMKSDS